MIIENFLHSLGLGENEIKIYLYLLTHGESLASIIAKRLEMKRVTAYSTLENLEKKGMVSSFTKNNVAHFDAVEPDDIIQLCEQKVTEMQRIKQNAMTLKSEFHKLREKGKMPKLEIRGKISYYQGLEAVTDLIEETLKEEEKEQLCFGLNSYHTELAGNDWSSYTEKRIREKMFVRSIQPNTEAAINYKSRDKNELRQTRLVPKDKFPGNCEINIIGKMIAMFTTRGSEAMGMKMYNPDMAQALRSLFNLAWERAENYDSGMKKNKKK
ncbi:MAG: helix-turn-helix domain-containing protein [Candidatus Gracilibacteria bacterium]|jgi:sugar-specific transcriptional regulator TrmB